MKKKDIQTSGFGLAPIVKEGGIADPDSYVWECNCDMCTERYNNWKKLFDKEQKKLRGKR